MRVSHKREIAKKCIKEESYQDAHCCLLVAFRGSVGALQADVMYCVFVLLCTLFVWACLFLAFLECFS